MPQSPATPLPSPKERRRLREAKSLSQADVAAKVGVTRETVRSWETGRTSPRGRKRDAYAKLLDAIADEQSAVVRTAEPAPPSEPSAPPVVDTPAPKPKPKNGTPHNGSAADRGRSRTRPEPTAKRASKPRATPRDSRKLPHRGLAPVGARRTAPASPGPESSERSDQPSLTPAQAFDALCAHCAPSLVRQTYLLTGHRTLARESVERAFQLAWQRWPEVAVDRDPAGWVRAAAYEYAMSPWHRFRPSQRHPDAPPAEPADRAFLAVLLSLPPAQRRTLLLYDGVGLDLPETAAETEASTPAAANRLLHAREAVAERLPELATPDALHRRLGELGGAEKLGTPKAERIRTGSEHRARFWTRTAIAFTALIIGATALTLRTAPTHYEPPQAPGKAISGVPARMGPGPLSYEETELRKKLREELASGPERLTPRPE
ncbi:helix-turn-helix domain-containing protein [Streptomyces kanamyceticus]|uniref:Helix-turn-helix domain-containing protein n=1 Tax=Streptomyces kanamyceticus TaxID=1967 RepID=A0A5J6GEP3_STRKN|nr:helix-turn-helix domain-containing protein [Streptomyces kanamyceticus]QEU92335.1 helix-turn-helix domain-containing protein [Streptomyces kanamyceticus]